MKLPPPDDALTDPLLRAFLARLAEASRSRDKYFILGALHGVVYDDQTDTGLTREAFIACYLSAPEEYVWPILDFALGCPFAHGFHGLVHSPYLVADPYCRRLSLDQVVARPGVSLRLAPDVTSPVLRTLDYDVVTYHSDPTPHAEWSEEHPLRRSSFIGVQTADGLIGFVRRGEVLSAGDPHLTLKQAGSIWRISGIVGGCLDDAWLTLD